MLESDGDKFSLPIKELRTVVPVTYTFTQAIGGRVKVLAGEYFGKVGTLKKVNFDQYTAQIEIDSSGNSSKSIITNLPYEQFSKIYV